MLFAWPRGSTQLFASPSGAMWPICVPRSARVLEEAREEGLESREKFSVNVDGNCSLASFLRRSFAFKRQCTPALFAWRRGHQRRAAMRALRGFRGPTHVPRGPAAPRGSIPSGSNCVARIREGPARNPHGTRVGPAGPARDPASLSLLLGRRVDPRGPAPHNCATSLPDERCPGPAQHQKSEPPHPRRARA